MKRVVDLILVLVALPFWILLVIVIGLLIYLEDKGSVFYKAPRLGKKGKIIFVYKFRSMKMNAPDLRNKDSSTFNAKDDPRLTKIGKFIRKTSIDETPQIVNVLKNEMSIIGPRPDLPEHINCYEGNEIRKLEVLPGITGYNQANYRNSIEWKERLKNDVYYVDHLTLRLDMQVLFKTIGCIIFKKGIYAEIQPKDEVKKNFTCYKLDWDTRYFGIKSSRVNLTGSIEDEDQKQIIEFCRNLEFNTISNLENRKENNQWIGEKTNAFLCDINLQFLKKINIEPKTEDEATQVYNFYPRDNKVIEIAHKAFLHSRFFNDSKLPKIKAENIYTHWTECAFEKESKYFVIAKRNNEVAGFCLFNMDRESTTAIIELIAVDEVYKGQKVGTSLVKAMEVFAYKNGVNKIKVGTQADNIEAVQFYTAVGFDYISCGAVYHLWNKA